MNRLGRTSLLNLILLMSAISCFAQRANPSTGAAQDRPSPSRASHPHSWKEFSSADGRFSILLPGTPTKKSTIVDTKVGPINIHMFSLETNVVAYMVAYSDFPITTDDPDVSRRLLDGGRDQLLANKQRRLISESEIKIGDYLGREVVLKDQGVIAKSRMYLVKQRLYQVTLVVPDNQNALSDTVKLNEANEAKFLDSFKLITPMDW